jgi:hypothetical protein
VGHLHCPRCRCCCRSWRHPFPCWPWPPCPGRHRCCCLRPVTAGSRNRCRGCVQRWLAGRQGQAPRCGGWQGQAQRPLLHLSRTAAAAWHPLARRCRHHRCCCRRRRLAAPPPAQAPSPAAAQTRHPAARAGGGAPLAGGADGSAPPPPGADTSNTRDSLTPNLTRWLPMLAAGPAPHPLVGARLLLCALCCPSATTPATRQRRRPPCRRQLLPASPVGSSLGRLQSRRAAAPGCHWRCRRAAAGPPWYAAAARRRGPALLVLQPAPRSPCFDGRGLVARSAGRKRGSWSIAACRWRQHIGHRSRLGCSRQPAQPTPHMAPAARHALSSASSVPRRVQSCRHMTSDGPGLDCMYTLSRLNYTAAGQAGRQAQPRQPIAASRLPVLLACYEALLSHLHRVAPCGPIKARRNAGRYRQAGRQAGNRQAGPVGRRTAGQRTPGSRLQK